jgi:hypothetical protein
MHCGYYKYIKAGANQRFFKVRMQGYMGAFLFDPFKDVVQGYMGHFLVHSIVYQYTKLAGERGTKSFLKEGVV